MALAVKARVMEGSDWFSIQQFIMLAILTLGVITGIVSLMRVQFMHAIDQSIDLATRLEERVAERTATIQRLLATWQEMTAEASHDLRSLMTVAEAELELMRMDLEEGLLTPTNVQDAMGRIRNVRQLELGLVDDLYTLSVLEANHGALVLRPTYYDIGARLRTIINGMGRYLAQNGVQITVTTPNEPVLVFADPSRIDRVLINVLTNAAKFTRAVRTNADGSITVTISEREGMVEILVTDNGTGIAAEQLHRIGERWARDTSQALPEGTGLGVHFCRAIVTMLGGAFHIDSAGVMQGTTITIRLPHHEPHTKEDDHE
jgi:signal transduction histidine kinase